MSGCQEDERNSRQGTRMAAAFRRCCSYRIDCRGYERACRAPASSSRGVLRLEACGAQRDFERVWAAICTVLDPRLCRMRSGACRLRAGSGHLRVRAPIRSKKTRPNVAVRSSLLERRPMLNGSERAKMSGC